MSEEKSDEIKVLQQKAKYFFDNNKIIHITYKDGSWNNGSIKEEPREDFFLLEEFEDGELPIFYLQIKNIEIYTVKEVQK